MKVEFMFDLLELVSEIKMVFCGVVECLYGFSGFFQIGLNLFLVVYRSKKVDLMVD